MSIDTTTTADTEMPTPSKRVRALDRLVGTWNVTGGAEGTVRYEWMQGGYFLVQHVELEQVGQHITGTEIIRQLRPFGEEPDGGVRSRYYDSMGNTLDYVYELDGDTLTIWGGEKGSPAYNTNHFSEDGNSLSGEWVYPGGGGYDTIMTRVN